jgi:O-antigen/teichoic acid export membrane protein
MKTRPAFLAAFSLKERFNVEVLWNVASLGVLAAAGMIINILIARRRDEAALGVFNQVYAIYIMLSQISVGGLHFSVLKSVSHNQDDRRKCADIAVSALILSAGTAAVVVGAAWLLRGWAGRMLDSPGVAVGLALAAPGLFCFSLNKILLNVLNGLRHMRAYAVFQALRFLFLFLAVWLILIGGSPGDYLAFALTASEALLFLLLIAYLQLRVLSLKSARRAPAWFGEHVSFGLRGFFSGLLSEMNTRVDVLLLGWFCSDGIVGVYSFAALPAEGFCQLPVVIRRNVDPILGQSFAAHDRKRIETIAPKVRNATYLAMGLISVVATAVYPLIPRLFVGKPEFAASWGVFAILMAGIALNSGYRPFLGILLQGGRPGMNTLLIAGVVGGNALLNLLLIPWLGMYGSALGTALAFVLEAALLILLARRLFDVRL